MSTPLPQPQTVRRPLSYQPLSLRTHNGVVFIFERRSFRFSDSIRSVINKQLTLLKTSEMVRIAAKVSAPEPLLQAFPDLQPKPSCTECKVQMHASCLASVAAVGKVALVAARNAGEVYPSLIHRSCSTCASTFLCWRVHDCMPLHRTSRRV